MPWIPPKSARSVAQSLAELFVCPTAGQKAAIEETTSREETIRARNLIVMRSSYLCPTAYWSKKRIGQNVDLTLEYRNFTKCFMPQAFKPAWA